MSFQNSQLGFLYRQFFITPAPLPASLSLRGKVGIVTGSNTGLGFQASAQLLAAGLSHLILAVRDIAKGEKAKQTLLSQFSQDLPKSEMPPVIDYTPDLRIDFAILNAGVANFAYDKNPSTQHEVMIQINWLSNALMCVLLAPILQSQYERAGGTGRPPVISIVGSETAARAKFPEAKRAERNNTNILKELDDQNNFDMTDRYYTSKLLLLLFFLEFNSGADAAATCRKDVIINLIKPGFCYGSELHRSAGGVLGTMLGIVKRVVGRSTSIGAKTLAHGAVVAGQETHGKYLSDEKVSILANYVRTKKGAAIQKQLWKEMVQELGLHKELVAES